MLYIYIVVHVFSSGKIPLSDTVSKSITNLYQYWSFVFAHTTLTYTVHSKSDIFLSSVSGFDYETPPPPLILLY